MVRLQAIYKKYFKSKYINGLKVTVWEKIFLYMVKKKKNRFEEVLPIADKIDFTSKTVIKDKKRHILKTSQFNKKI